MRTFKLTISYGLSQGFMQYGNGVFDRFNCPPLSFLSFLGRNQGHSNYLQRLVDQLLGIYNLPYILWQEQNLNTIKFKQGKKEILKKFEKLSDGQTKLNNSLDMVIKTKGHKNRFQSNIGRADLHLSFLRNLA